MLADQITEVIFVGLPGPTHHYGGLSGDNVASERNRGSVSNPKQAALQVLGLLRLLASLGVAAAVLPPQLRPHMPLLRLHFEGSDEEVIRKAAIAAPALLEKASSASAMWVANAATVAPYVDCADGKLHLTVANLFSHLHRRIEAEDSYRVLHAIFDGVPDAVVHPPLSAAMGLHDEGAANHMRLSPGFSAKGLHVFVYGADGSRRDPESARQTLSASKAVAREHALAGNAALFLRQNPEIIKAGVFHNDVIAVSNEHALLVHERAYEGGRADIDRIRQAYGALHPDTSLAVIVVREEELSVEEAVHTYLFNSQIVTRADGAMTLIAPVEVGLLFEGRAQAVLERIRADGNNPIDEIRTVDLRQSMRNGGGPACLRLRVPMGQSQLAAMAKNVRVLADEALLAELERVIEAHYPEALTAEDLQKPELALCSRKVMEELSAVLRIPPP